MVNVPGGGVLPYMALTRTCSPIGYGFQSVCLKQRIDFTTFCLKQGIATRPSGLDRSMLKMFACKIVNGLNPGVMSCVDDRTSLNYDMFAYRSLATSHQLSVGFP